MSLELIQENIKLKAEIERWRSTDFKLTCELTRLECENRQLKSELEQLKSELEQLKSELEQLKIEKSEILSKIEYALKRNTFGFHRSW